MKGEYFLFTPFVFLDFIINCSNKMVNCDMTGNTPLNINIETLKEICLTIHLKIIMTNIVSRI